MDHLAAAAKALGGAPDPVLALDHLVRAWRDKHRWPELAELVEALSAKLTSGLTPIDPNLSDADYHAAWIARASEAASFELELLVPGMFRGPLGKRVKERFELLVRFEDDPRLHAAFARMITEPPVMASSNFGIWSRLFGMLTAAPDIRLRPVLERRLETVGGSSQFWPMLNQRCFALLKRLPERLPEPSDGEREQIAALRAQITALEAFDPSTAAARPGDTLAAELLAHVHAEPDVIEHRIVWADALISAGDPRGEFAQLQLARPPDQLPSKRERQLLTKHALAWLGPLAAVIERKTLRYEQGFPASAEVVFDSATERDVIHDPAWATFRALECNDVELLTHPNLRALRRAGGLGFAQLRRLCEHVGEPTGLYTLGPIIAEQLPPFELDHLRAAPATWLANVRELWLHLDDHNLSRQPSAFAWLFDTPLGRRLTSFRLSAFPFASGDPRGLDATVWLQAMRDWNQLERLRLDLHNVSIELVRDGLRAKLRVFSEFGSKPSDYHMDSVRTLLEGIGTQFDTIEFVSHAREPMLRETLVSLAKATGFVEYGYEHAPSDDPGVGSANWRARRSLIQRQERSARRRTRSRKQTRPIHQPLEDTPWFQLRDGIDRMRLTHGGWVEFSDDSRELWMHNDAVCGLSAPGLEPRWRLAGQQHGSYVSSVAIDRARARMWIGTGQGLTLLWDLEAQRALARARFHRSLVGTVAVVPGRELLLSCDRDGKLHAWQYAASDDDECVVMTPHASASLDRAADVIAVDPGGDTLALLKRTGEVSLRAVDELGRPRVIGNVGSRNGVLRWAPGGDHLVAAEADGGLVIWGADGTELTRVRLHEQMVRALCWTPDGRALVTASDCVRVSDRDTGAELLRIEPGRGQIGGVAVSPDGQILAVSAWGNLSCWSLTDGRLLGRYPAASGGS
ncbi:WD40 repeat domain-containing protein [Enhygromyxa salina]|uniref:WD domain, G-beta repeat n=1 Tax=Enhygromyxa salina TaxID=215803 RepID=A0A2S9YDL3_9BACT|nr:hypothetical protein [Enhygromyxa salina]PRQ03208.1 WD domain, G-beta repeat [Enhygromyxa salina]